MKRYLWWIAEYAGLHRDGGFLSRFEARGEIPEEFADKGPMPRSVYYLVLFGLYASFLGFLIFIR